MKKITYKTPGYTTVIAEDGTEQRLETFATVSLPYSEENLKIAQAESFGEVTVTDDGTPEAKTIPSQEERISALEEALLEMVLGGES